MERHPANPILTRADIPAISPHLCDVTSVFNPGAIRWQGRDLLLLRVQTRGRETVLMLAESADGVHFDVQPRVLEIEGLADTGQSVYHVYDPRLTAIDETVYVVFAADTDAGCRLGIARTTDFACLTLVSFDATGDTRNGVLFPQCWNGRYRRLERPNTPQQPGSPTSGNEIILSESADLVTWRSRGHVMSGRPRYWDELIGSGPPPIRTREGWLQLYHGVATHFAATNIYQAGVALLDLEDPRRVLARARNNILEPRAPYELVGQVPNVVFPTGAIVEKVEADGCAAPDSPVRVYYGAADTVIGLATTTIDRLLAACREQ